MMKTIFFVTPNLANGGAERVTAILAGELAKLGHRVTLLYMKDDKTVYPLDEALSIQMLWTSGSKIKRIVGKIGRLRRLMKRNPDAAFLAMLPFETLYTFIASLGLPCRVVYSLRNDPGNMTGTCDFFAMKWIYPHADMIVFQTDDARCFFCQRVQKRSVVIPNPIPAALPERYCGERRHEIVTAGRLTEQKNYPLLLHAFAAVHQKHADWILRIFGQGEQREQLERLCERLKITDCVVFCGFVPNVAEQINQSGIFVMASNYEGISNALLEALATGVPCISTDCPIGGARMMIQDHENGLLVPVGDETAMTQALLELIEHPELRCRFSAQSLSICSKLAADTIARKWEGIL